MLPISSSSVDRSSHNAAPQKNPSLSFERSAFVDYDRVPFHDHDAARNPVKPVLGTAALRHVYDRINRRRRGSQDDALVEGGEVQLLKEVLGLAEGKGVLVFGEDVALMGDSL